MGNALALALEKPAQEIDSLIKFLSSGVDQASNGVRHFFDNFTEIFKEAIVTSKKLIAETMNSIVAFLGKVYTILKQVLKQTISQLVITVAFPVENLVELVKKFYGYMKSFFSYLKEAKEKTFKRLQIKRLHLDEGVVFDHLRTLLALLNLLYTIWRPHSVAFYYPNPVELMSLGQNELVVWTDVFGKAWT